MKGLVYIMKFQRKCSNVITTNVNHVSKVSVSFILLIGIFLVTTLCQETVVAQMNLITS